MFKSADAIEKAHIKAAQITMWKKDYAKRREKKIFYKNACTSPLRFQIQEL